MNDQLIAKWTDERGDNVVNGTVVEDPQKMRDAGVSIAGDDGTDGLVLVSFAGHGLVRIPEGAELFQPARPEMVPVGHVVNGKVGR